MIEVKKGQRWINAIDHEGSKYYKQPMIITDVIGIVVFYYYPNLDDENTSRDLRKVTKNVLEAYYRYDKAYNTPLWRALND
jgi:hypothetical protein